MTNATVHDVLPNRLFRIELSSGQAYLWLDADGLTLVDSGRPDAAEEIVRRSNNWGGGRRSSVGSC